MPTRFVDGAWDLHMALAHAQGLLSLARDRAQDILLLGGWRRLALTGAAGAVSALAQAPLDLLPALAIGFPLAILTLDGVAAEGGTPLRRVLAAAILGWWFGFGYFLAGLWWLGQAFIAGGSQFIWLMPLGVIGLPAALALFPALGFAIARLLWSPGAMRIFAFAFGLGLSEWLRSWLLTGFPWNGFGQAFANHLLLAQAASVVGAEGMGLVALLVFAAPVLMFSGGSGWPGRFAGVTAIIVFGACAAFGYLRLEGAGGATIDYARLDLVPGIRLRLMQPNLPQDEKNGWTDGAAVLARYLALSDRAKGAHASGIADVTHLIWPEAPFPFVLDRNPRAIEEITRFLPPATLLVTGAVRAEPDGGAERGFRFYNAMQVVGKSGVVATYDKLHLVPFGEFLPFDRFLRALGLQQFVRVVGGFSAGVERRAFQVPGLPAILPLICFEAIFPQDVARGLADRGGGAIINVTNDAWFGRTFGPHQHLAQARMRAIEFGLPLVRAANTGISAVIDPYGRTLAMLPLGTEDVLDSPLPASLPNTLYRTWTWYSFAAVMICLGLLALSGSRQG